MATRKRKFIKVGTPEAVVVRAGKHSNKLYLRVTLTRQQELNLLKMLKERNPKAK